MNLQLAAHPPFSLSAAARSHGWLQLVPFEWACPERRPELVEGLAEGPVACTEPSRSERDADAGVLTRVERLSTGRVVELCMRGSGPGVRVEGGEELTDVERQEVAEKVTWMLDLDLDLGPFYALTRHEPRLAGLEERARGRILRSPTLFEDVVKTILTTNVQWSGTIRMVERLVSEFGDPLSADSARHAFPTPERLAAADEEGLRSAGLGYRAPYVLELARSVVSSERDLEALKSAELPTAELRKRLLAIKGVGDYAAANLLILLGHYDFLPVDSWAMTMVSREWYQGEPVGRAEVEAAFERWGQWKGLAYWFWDWTGGE